MKVKKLWILISVVCCAVFLSAGLFGISVEERAQLDTYGFSTLQGLDGVYPPGVTVMARTIQDSITSFVEGAWDELDEACFSIQRELNKEVMLSIQKAGVKIIPILKNELQNDNAARLWVAVTVRKPMKDSPLYAFTVHIELTQDVQLVRNPKIRTSVPTWPNSISRPNIFLVGGFAEMKQAIRSEVASKTNQFIEDYLAANPKK